MNPPLIPREEAAANLSVSTRVLLRYEARGLVRAERDGAVEGYPPAAIGRLWTIVTCQRDLGINLAGVEALLKLRAHLEALHRDLGAFSGEFAAWLDARDEAGRRRDG